MAVSKTLDSTTLSIEVRKGTDASGEATYSKKSFSGVKNDADPQNIFDVAEAIKNVLEKETRNYSLTQSALLLQSN